MFEPYGSGIAESLLYKRKEFSHEKEVRLIYTGRNTDPTSDIYSFKIDVNDIFEEIIFDPRMDREMVIAYTLAIKNKNFINRVAQSTLYNPPKGLCIRI